MVLVHSLLSTVLITVVAAKSPNNNYVPGSVDCPSTPILRSAEDLSTHEHSYVNSRWHTTQNSLRQFVQNLNLKDINLDDIFWTSPEDGTQNSVNIGIAVPGGGFKALMIAGGALTGLDDRETSVNGRLKGLLQSASHISGLSGGSWLLGSMYLNDFPTISKLRDNKRIWRFNNDLALPGNGGVVQALSYYAVYVLDLLGKAGAGFQISFTDLWGRMLSNKLIDDKNNSGAAIGWSDIAEKTYFKKHYPPYPIILAEGRSPHSKDVLINATLYEITPHEIGSYDPSLHAFAQLKYLGTKLDNNKPVDNKCITGYDNAGLLMGASSNVFNSVIRREATSDRAIRSALGGVASILLDDTNLDIATINPNPFRNYNNKFRTTNDDIAKSEFLALTDGGTDAEVIPFWPLLKRERNLDMILAFDVGTETKNNWPSGNSLVTTYTRYQSSDNNADVAGNSRVIFPKVPDTNSFVNLGLTSRPTFFGCYAKDYSPISALDNGDFSEVPPIVLYIANAPYSHMTNNTIFQIQYSQEDSNGHFDNGLEMINQSDDENWPQCVGCAVIQRERERQGDYEPTEQCKQCFDKYCWDGKVDPRDPETAGLHNNPSLRRNKV